MRMKPEHKQKKSKDKVKIFFRSLLRMGKQLEEEQEAEQMEAKRLAPEEATPPSEYDDEEHQQKLDWLNAYSTSVLSHRGESKAESPKDGEMSPLERYSSLEEDFLSLLARKSTLLPTSDDEKSENETKEECKSELRTWMDGNSHFCRDYNLECKSNTPAIF